MHEVIEFNFYNIKNTPVNKKRQLKQIYWQTRYLKNPGNGNIFIHTVVGKVTVSK